MGCKGVFISRTCFHDEERSLIDLSHLYAISLSDGGESDSNLGVIVGSVVGSSVLVIGILVAVLCIIRMKYKLVCVFLFIRYLVLYK